MVACVCRAVIVPAGVVARHAARRAAGIRYNAPRTPWGDPDIQGNYTNLTEAGTPLEKPKELEGRNLSDIQRRGAARDQAPGRRTDDRRVSRPGPRRPTTGGKTPIGRSSTARRRGSWSIPPDGRIPPLTPEAQRKQQAAAEARKRNTRGPADSYTDRSLYDRCITRGFPNSGMPTIYGNSSHIVQGPGYVAITYEMIHDTRIIPLAPRPHVGTAIRTDFGDPRGHWEGDDAGGRDHELPGAQRLPQRQRGSAQGDRAVQADWTQDAAVDASPSTIRRPGPGRGRSRCPRR